MNQELFEALEALCDMWSQYCGDEWGHSFMTAGENTQDVLDKYGLLTPSGNGIQCYINYEKLEEYRKSII